MFNRIFGVTLCLAVSLPAVPANAECYGGGGCYDSFIRKDDVPVGDRVFTADELKAALSGSTNKIAGLPGRRALGPISAAYRTDALLARSFDGG